MTNEIDPLKLPAVQSSPERPLTELQVRFADHWLRYRNGVQAYKAAAGNPNLKYHSAATEAQRLLRDARIQEHIKARAKVAFADAAVDVAWLLQRFVGIATADPRELIGLHVGCCRYCYGEGGLYQWREREYLEALDKAEAASRDGQKGVLLPDPAGGFGFNATLEPVEDCAQCHGEGLERFVPRDTNRLSDEALLLYGGVKVKADGGYEIIIADRQRALEMVGRILGAYTDRVDMRGAITAMVAVADMRGVDPATAQRAYRQMIENNMAA